MRKFTLAAAVAVGLLGFASTADAQYRYRSSYVYPTYGYSTYSYPSYSYSYPYSTSGVVLSSGYTPVYSSSYYSPYSSGYYSPAYSGGYYGNNYYDGYYGNSYSPWGGSSYYGNYGYPIYSSGGWGGLNVTTRGAYFGGRRIGRW